MNRACLLLFLTTVVSMPAAADRQVVFLAKPSVRCKTLRDTSFCETLPKSQQHEFQLLITKEPDATGRAQYVWATRGSRPLERYEFGVYTTFFSPVGYVKIENNLAILQRAERLGVAAGVPDDLPQFNYIEHVIQNLATITYYGSAEALDP